MVIVIGRWNEMKKCGGYVVVRSGARLLGMKIEGGYGGGN
jgi:hypothetical protein